MGFRCRLHGYEVPCRECSLFEYNKAVRENKEGKNPPHDLKALKEFLQIVD